jgi:DNA-directed RNA polymerase specialized sigma24 family protein
MDMSSAAIKSLLSRARENLRVILEPYVTQGSFSGELLEE